MAFDRGLLLEHAFLAGKSSTSFKLTCESEAPNRDVAYKDNNDSPSQILLCINADARVQKAVKSTMHSQHHQFSSQLLPIYKRHFEGVEVCKQTNHKEVKDRYNSKL